MCNRVKRPSNDAALADEFDIHDYMDEHPDALRSERDDEYGPMDKVPVVVHDGNRRVLRFAQWWYIPEWSKTGLPGDRSTFLARSDKIGEAASMYHGAFKHRRCLVPVTGFYEYKPLPGKKKARYYFSLNDAPVFALAGLWSRWEPKKGPLDSALDSFAIVTTDANEIGRTVHGRMPVIIPRVDYARWLDPASSNIADLSDLLSPSPSEGMSVVERPREPSVGSSVEKKKDAPSSPAQGELF